MANVKTGGLMAAKQNQPDALQETKKKTIAAAMNALVDGAEMRGRINELLGKRASQFVSSLVSLVTGDANMQKVFQQAPMTIIQAAIRAATYDLPVDPGLGYAYIVPFNNKQKDGSYRMEASFIMGYKGMYQLALRTGVYKKINVVDVRAGELVHYDQLTEDIELDFIDDEEERASKEIIGYCGFFRLVNGMEKCIYMTVKQIKQHEEKNRKGKTMGKGWRDDFDAMARKTVLRKLIGKWGIMSIDYKTADATALKIAKEVSQNGLDDEDAVTTIEAEAAENTQVLADGRQVNTETGEVFESDVEANFEAAFTPDEIEAAIAGK